MSFTFTSLNVTAKTLKYAAQGGGTTTLGWPPGRQTGDIAILIQNARSSSSTIPSDATPSGFTQLSTDSGIATGSSTGARASVSYRVLDGSESGILSGGLSGNIATRSYMWIFRPSFTITGVTIARTYQLTDSAPTDQTISEAGTYPMLFLATYESTSTLISTRSFTPATGVLTFQAAISSFTRGRSFNGLAPTTTVGMSDADTNALLSMRINVT